MAIDNLRCPDCGGPMVSRTTKPKGTFMQAPRRFWGCLNYPVCKGTRDTDGRSKAERRQDRREEDDA